MPYPIQHTVLERFLRYVVVDTQSDPNATQFPSTEKQKNLAKVLVEELLALVLPMPTSTNTAMYMPPFLPLVPERYQSFVIALIWILHPIAAGQE